jgi:nitroreductase
MRTRPSIRSAVCISFISALAACAFAQGPGDIRLPAPVTEGGKPLMQVLRERKSTREFSSEKLPLTVLSNLLWAAFGINRETGQRTAPSASNRQETDISVAMSEGLFLYEAKGHFLKRILGEDLRALTGTQDWVKDAPVNLIYVTDLTRGKRSRPEDIEFYSGAGAGFIAENVYLYCASEGLGTVVRASVDRPVLAQAMKLRSDQKIALAQSVGYPKK